MKTNSLLLIFLRMYAYFWIILGVLGLIRVLYVLQQGRFEIPFYLICLPDGIGLLRKDRTAWISVLILLFVFLAFEAFLFLMVSGSSGFATDVMTFTWDKIDIGTVPNVIFYPVSFGLLVIQIWFLLLKPVRQIFSSKTI